MIKNNIEDIYQLSPMQQGILFHSLYAPEVGVYFEQLSCTLHSNLNISAFEQAWEQVLARHQPLRTAFIWERQDKPLAVVYRQVKLPLELNDWRGLSPVEQLGQLQAFLQYDQKRGFKLSQPPLMRLTLIQVDEDVYQFVWSHHHLLMDGWSLPLVLKEVFACYEACCQNHDLHLKPSFPYRDYIAWLLAQDLADAEVFWRQALKGFSAPTPLAVDKALASNEQEGYNDQQLYLTMQATAALQSLARQHQLTLNTLVQGAWAILLSRYSGEADVVFGVTVSGRPAAIRGVESIVGLLINTLPMRVQVSADDSLLSWLQQIQNQQVEIRQYEYSPLVQVQGWSEVPRGLPLFESIVVFENYPVDISLRERGTNLQVRDVRSFERTNYPLTLVAVPGAKLSLRLSYQRHRFDAATIARMLGHFQTLLEGMVANPNQRLSELPLLSAAEQHQVLVEWNDTQADYPKHVCIHQLFEATVTRSPDAIAVVFENEQLTYQELNIRANKIAHHLQALGVEPDVLVGIYMERSLEMVVGLLGILKAGGAYVPLDPAYPKERLSFMLQDAQVAVLLTQQRLVEGLQSHGAKVVCLDTDWETIAHRSQENLASVVTADNLAYVIYTSGSTGNPKGIGLAHRPLMNLLEWHFSSLDKGARTLQFASLSFDASFHEIFATWGSGGTLFMISEKLRVDTVGLGQFILEQAIEKVILPVVVLQQLAELVGEQGIAPLHARLFSSLREVITTGEQLRITQSIIKLFKSLEHCEFHNHYGPSETHVVTALSLGKNPDEWSSYPPIGIPITNTQIYLMDKHFNPVPVGVPGEVYIGGVSLARGYLNRPALTAEKFIPNPFSAEPDARMYKTGDLARYLPDGYIEYLGRLDHQVKVRGFRIELGEIEAVLRQHPAVWEVVVLAREDEAGNKRLIAYVVSNQESAPTTSELRRFVQEKLPNYMVPSAFMLLEALPLTPNGKVDRRALPALDLVSELKETFVAPQTAAEQVVAEIWRQVLGLEQVGIHDNFFELGGHSLLATQIISKLRQAFQVELPIRSLFEAPTVEGMVNVIAQSWGDREVVEEIARTLQEVEKLSPEEVKTMLLAPKL